MYKKWKYEFTGSNTIYKSYYWKTKYCCIMSLKFRGGGDGHQRGRGIGGLLRKNKETANNNIETYAKVSKVKKGKKKKPN